MNSPTFARIGAVALLAACILITGQSLPDRAKAASKQVFCSSGQTLIANSKARVFRVKTSTSKEIVEWSIYVCDYRRGRVQEVDSAEDQNEFTCGGFSASRPIALKSDRWLVIWGRERWPCDDETRELDNDSLGIIDIRRGNWLEADPRHADERVYKRYDTFNSALTVDGWLAFSHGRDIFLSRPDGKKMRLTYVGRSGGPTQKIQLRVTRTRKQVRAVIRWKARKHTHVRSIHWRVKSR